MVWFGMWCGVVWHVVWCGGGGVVDWIDAGETLNVTLELVRRGYSKDDIQKLWGGNLLRVWRKAEKVAAQSSK